jgi:hypothetical protein
MLLPLTMRKDRSVYKRFTGLLYTVSGLQFFLDLSRGSQFAVHGSLFVVPVRGSLFAIHGGSEAQGLEGSRFGVWHTT